jgi:ABC-type lipoprotein export system ATPase subunit
VTPAEAVELLAAPAGDEPHAARVPPTATATEPAAELRDVTKRHGDRTVLDGVTVAFAPGRVTAVVGRSGSGKTTLLHLIAGLELPNAGLVEVAGTPLGELNRSERAALRRRGIALVTQEPGLVPYLSALENVELGLTLRGTAGADAREALAVVGLAERVDQQVARLSAGERQRVAIARALAADVNLILLDEPTARLDEANARSVAALLLRLANERSTTILCATHDPLLIDLAADVLRLDGGGSPALAG